MSDPQPSLPRQPVVPVTRGTRGTRGTGHECPSVALTLACGAVTPGMKVHAFLAGAGVDPGRRRAVGHAHMPPPAPLTHTHTHTHTHDAVRAPVAAGLLACPA